MRRPYFLRLLNGGGWELFENGHITCSGSVWSPAMATHMHRLICEREGRPITNNPPVSSPPIDIDTFLKRMAAL